MSILSARIVQLEIVPKDQAVEDEPRILVGPYSTGVPEIFSLNSDVHELGDYPFVLEFEDQYTGGVQTPNEYLKIEFLNKVVSPTVIKTRIFNLSTEASALGVDNKIRIYSEDIAVIQQKSASIFIRLTGCASDGTSPAAYYEYDVDGETETILQYRWKRSKNLFFSTVNKTRVAFSTLPNLKFILSTVDKARIAFSTLPNLKLFFSTINKNRFVITTPSVFASIQVPIAAKLTLLNNSSLLRIEDNNTYNVSRQRDDYKIYTVLFKNEDQVAVRNSNNPDSSVLWEFTVGNGVYELFYIVVPGELAITVEEGNAYKEILNAPGVSHVKYTIPVSKEILSCLEELNDKEIERLLQNLETEKNTYIHAESLYISMLVAASKNDMKTTLKLKQILEGLCINCGCGC